MRRFVEAPLCSVLLGVLGFLTVHDREFEPRRLPIPASAATASPDFLAGRRPGSAHAVCAGDLLVCNHSSFADVLLLASRFAPQFVLTGLDGSARLGSTWEALTAATRLPAATVLPGGAADWGPGAPDPHAAVGAARALPLGATVLGVVAAAAAAGPLALFSEGGARTNGRTVLATGAAAADVAAGGASRRLREADRAAAAAAAARLVTHVVCVSYPPSPASAPVSPTHPTGSAAAALWAVMGTPYLSATVARLAAGREPQLADCKAPTDAEAGSTGVEMVPGAPFKSMEWREAVQAVLVQMLAAGKAVPVSWNAADGIEFELFARYGRLPSRETAKKSS